VTDARFEVSNFGFLIIKRTFASSAERSFSQRNAVEISHNLQIADFDRRVFGERARMNHYLPLFISDFLHMLTLTSGF
jgi:hypothetical protein